MPVGVTTFGQLPYVGLRTFCRGLAEASADGLHDNLERQYEDQGRRLLLGGDPMQSLAYLEKAGEMGVRLDAEEYTLDWYREDWPGRKKIFIEREIKIRSSLTHEEMAQMIGSSRETVTRLLSDLKKRELIRLEGSTLVIQDRSGLEALAA